MSIDATRWAWMHRDIKPTQKLILLALADRADEKHRCWPSLRRLAFDTGFDERTIKSALRAMCEQGIINRTETQGRGYTYYLVDVNGREDTPLTGCTGYKNVPPSSNAGASDVPPASDVPGTLDVPPPPSSSVPPPPSLDAPRIYHESINEPSEKKRARKPKVEKLNFGTFGNVKMTQQEHDKLFSDHPDLAEAAIEKLDSYIGSTGKSYKSHYMTMFSWVLDAVRDERGSSLPNRRASPGNGFNAAPSLVTEANMQTVREVLEGRKRQAEAGYAAQRG